MRVLAEKGYQATTVSSITSEADVAHGTFYLYFANKDEVVVGLVAQVWDELFVEIFAGEPSPPGGYDPRRPRMGVRAAVEVYVRHGRLWRSLLEAALTSKTVEREWFGRRRRVQDELVIRFARAQDAGLMRPIDPAVCAEGLMAMLEWFALNRLSFQETALLTDDRDVVDTLVDLWIHALGIEL
ncbi:MAG: TetR/AcrR family transcriptional regulator [Actinobacteria bacterium]|nr:TetR/AcrR family transcriptional regulator [Actinomycetota bacterium]